MAGLPAPALADGVSLLPALEGRTFSRGPAPLYFEYFNNTRTPNFPGFEASRRGGARQEMQAVRVGSLMGLRYNVTSAGDPFQLYDVVADPKQTRNLASDPAYADWSARLQALALQSRRPDPTAVRPYDEAPVPAGEITATQPGLTWQRFAGDPAWVPALPARPADAAGHAAGFTPAAALAGATGPAVLAFNGYVRAPADGVYTFTFATDTGAVVRLHQAVLFDCDRGYRPSDVQTATIALKAGLHPVTVLSRHPSPAAARLAFTWSGPGFADRPLAGDALAR
jgi:hypothetical protein